MPDVKFSNQYPYTDFHELNLDWVINEVKFWSERVGKSIQKIELTGTVGLVDTYTITYSDGTTSTFDVTNGNGIASVTKTGTAGLVDTYTITFQDGSTSTFEVHNGTASIDGTLTRSGWAADSKATGDAIKNRIPYSPGTQLFDYTGTYTTLHTGQYVNYNTGAIDNVPTLEWFMFNVTPGENYAISGDTNNIHVAYFSALPIGQSNYISGSLVPPGGYTTVPAGAVYMTISVRIITAAQLMVQTGTVATTYQSYQRGIKTADYLDKSVTIAKLADDVVTALGQIKKIVTIGSANCDYTNICTAIKENTVDTVFKLSPEVFDVEAAYEEEYSSTFFANYTRYSLHPDDPMYRGLNLGAGCELWGEPNTRLDFLYSGNNADVAQFFSVLSLTDNNTVNGITINIGGKCRYAIHDDYSTIAGSTNIVEHCVFTGTTSDPGRPYIGSGLGTASALIYRYNVFTGTSTRAIGAHNCVTTAMGRIEIYGCFCGSDIYVFHYGTSTAKTPAIVHDNKTPNVYLTHADPGAFPNDNIELYEWNNVS